MFAWPIPPLFFFSSSISLCEWQLHLESTFLYNVLFDTAWFILLFRLWQRLMIIFMWWQSADLLSPLIFVIIFWLTSHCWAKHSKRMAYSSGRFTLIQWPHTVVSYYLMSRQPLRHKLMLLDIIPSMACTLRVRDPSKCLHALAQILKSWQQSWGMSSVILHRVKSSSLSAFLSCLFLCYQSVWKWCYTRLPTQQ